MTRARLRRLALVLLGALTLRVELAAPAFAVAELRAVSHCAAHEGHPVRTADAARCCQVGAPGDDDANLAAPARVAAPADTPIALLAPAEARAPSPPPALEGRPPPDTGPPRFLALRTLLI